MLVRSIELQSSLAGVLCLYFWADRVDGLCRSIDDTLADHVICAQVGCCP